MKIEHIAIQHPDSVGAAAWYAKNLGMKIVREFEGPSRARFVADDSGSTVLEIYSNQTIAVPDYPNMSPLVLHIAFTAPDIEAEAKRLVAAGATLVDAPTVTAAGDKLGMLRDPWGVPLQLIQRAKPLL